MTSRILRSGLAEAITAPLSFLATTLAAGLFFGGMRYRVVSLRTTTRHYPATRSPRVGITVGLWARYFGDHTGGGGDVGWLD
jgi:hypothetical protein